MTAHQAWLAVIRELHELMREHLQVTAELDSVVSLSAVVRQDEGDTIYALDEVAAHTMPEYMERKAVGLGGVVLVAEGLPFGKVVLPSGSDEATAACCLIVDLIDGTRGLMYQKRSAWILSGIALVVRFFPGIRAELAALDDEIMASLLGKTEHGRPASFEDQYIASAGQLYGMAMGHDRVVADLRPLLARQRAWVGGWLPPCSHPYDLCAEPREAGVIVTDVIGKWLAAPLAVEPEVDWVAYENSAIRRLVEPVLQDALNRRGCLC